MKFIFCVYKSEVNIERESDLKWQSVETKQFATREPLLGSGATTTSSPSVHRYVSIMVMATSQDRVE